MVSVSEQEKSRIFNLWSNTKSTKAVNGHLHDKAKHPHLFMVSRGTQYRRLFYQSRISATLVQYNLKSSLHKVIDLKAAQIHTCLPFNRHEGAAGWAQHQQPHSTRLLQGVRPKIPSKQVNPQVCTHSFLVRPSLADLFLCAFVHCSSAVEDFITQSFHFIFVNLITRDKEH